MSEFSDHGILIGNGSGKTLCPECSHTRKHKADKCLSVNVDEGVWNCHNCGWAGSLKEKKDYVSREAPKIYTKPKEKPALSLPKNVVEHFHKRGISDETLKKMQVGFKDGWVQFPYFKNGELVNIKSRKGGKQFKQEKGAEQIFFNRDIALKYPGEIIIVEGEIDALSLIEAGIINVVSVPAGAPAKSGGELRAKFEFLDNDEELIESTNHWILATDSDKPGIALRDELARRLGRAKCLTVDWPEDSKDANDVLVKHGKERLIGIIGLAKPFPIYGMKEPGHLVASLHNFYEGGFKKGVPTGWNSLNEFYTVRPGEFSLVTGIPGHGKSEWLDALMVNLAKKQDWFFAIFSPENFPFEYHASRLLEKYFGMPFNLGYSERMTVDQVQTGMQWLQEHFVFINPPEKDITLDSVLDLGRAAVCRKGANAILIDPWNEIDHSREGGLTETEYISNCLRTIRRFARLNDVHIWLVVHPTKLKKNEDGRYPVPTPYDISGSAHWRNRADNCLAIYRDMGDKDVPVEIHIQKIRFKQVGTTGLAKLNYDVVSGCYSDISLQLMKP